MDIPTSGNNTETLKRKIQQYSIDISHFTFKASCRSSKKSTNINEYLTNKVKIQTSKLKINY